MRSQNWKSITIKNPTLRLVRTSLRVVLRKAIDTELDYLGQLRDLYRDKRSSGKLVPSQGRRECDIIKKSNDLLQTMTHSILKCGEGSRCMSIKENSLSSEIATIGEDMVWNPVLKRWNCIKCYSFYYKTDSQKQSSQDILNQEEGRERAFDEWLSK